MYLVYTCIGKVHTDINQDRWFWKDLHTVYDSLRWCLRQFSNDFYCFGAVKVLLSTGSCVIVCVCIYSYVHACLCMYTDMHVHTCMSLYIHVCTMHIRVYTFCLIMSRCIGFHMSQNWFKAPFNAIKSFNCYCGNQQWSAEDMKASSYWSRQHPYVRSRITQLLRPAQSDGRQCLVCMPVRGWEISAHQGSMLPLAQVRSQGPGGY
jgi:hypothetical protein